MISADKAHGAEGRKMGSAVDWVSVFVTLLLGIAGIVFARSIRRDVNVKLAERRLVAYERLWALMRMANPSNLGMDEATRRRLHDKFTDWYYEHGDGMLLDRVSHNMYLEAKNNLVCPLERLTPAESRERLRTLHAEQLERERGILAQRQLSMLRTQLKHDIQVFGKHDSPLRLGREDRAFLIACGAGLVRKPRSGPAKRDETERAAVVPPRATSDVTAQE